MSPTPTRHDGWTVFRQLDFLETLARTRNVAAAALSAGMSREGAYRLRNREPRGLFAAAWDRALGAGPKTSSRAEVDESHRRTIARACLTEGRLVRPDPRQAINFVTRDASVS